MKRNHANLPLSALVVFTSMAMNMQAANHTTNPLQAPQTIQSMERMEKENKSILTHFNPLTTTVRNIEMLEQDPCCCLSGTPEERLYTYISNQELKINGLPAGQEMGKEYLAHQKENIKKYLDETEKDPKLGILLAATCSTTCVSAMWFAPIIALTVGGKEALCLAACGTFVGVPCLINLTANESNPKVHALFANMFNKLKSD